MKACTSLGFYIKVETLRKLTYMVPRACKVWLYLSHAPQHATAETGFLVSWVYPNQSMTVIENCEQGMEIINSDIFYSNKVSEGSCRGLTQQLSHFPLPSLSHLTSLTHVAALQLTKQGWLHAVCKPITLFHWLWPPVDWIWFWFCVLTL